jgi:hypothetical protein
MFERRTDKLLPLPGFLGRLAFSFLFAFLIVTVGLTVGILGYHVVAHLSWVDAVLNASMILTGMGPVDPMPNTASKLFASGYALFSGVVFLSAMGIVLSPVFHRVLHKFHLDDGESTKSQRKTRPAA